MSDPENVTAPMMTSSSVVTVVRRSRRRGAGAARSRASATSAAAPPPTALNMLTSCGIAVICTVRAEYSPMPRADERPAISTIQPVAVISRPCDD